jgi:hypothetical protein
LVGGSGFSVGIVNHEGQAIAASPSTSWFEIGIVPDHTLTNERAIELLFNRLFDVTRELVGKDSNRLALFGVSFAGPLTGEGDQIFAHGTNMGVAFERPLKEYLVHFAHQAGFANVSRSKIVVLNDGAAGAFGELYAKNGAVGAARDLIYLILGTGVGGARVLNYQLDPTFTEAGHLLLRNREGEYSLCSISDLQSKGLFKEGAFVTPVDGSSYFEHYVGGPWVATRFAKFLRENSKTAFEQIALVTRPDRCPDFTREDVEKMAALKEENVADWNRRIDKSAERALNMLLRFHSEKGRTAPTLEFSQLAFQFEALLYAEIGKALRVLSHAFPEAEIVLGSSLAEVRKNNPEFLHMLSTSTNGQGRAQISQIPTGTEREAAALVPTLTALASQ